MQTLNLIHPFRRVIAGARGLSREAFLMKRWVCALLLLLLLLSPTPRQRVPDGRVDSRPLSPPRASGFLREGWIPGRRLLLLLLLWVRSCRPPRASELLMEGWVRALLAWVGPWWVGSRLPPARASGFLMKGWVWPPPFLFLMSVLLPCLVGWLGKNTLLKCRPLELGLSQPSYLQEINPCSCLRCSVIAAQIGMKQVCRHPYILLAGI